MVEREKQIKKRQLWFKDNWFKQLAVHKSEEATIWESKNCQKIKDYLEEEESASNVFFI